MFFANRKSPKGPSWKNPVEKHKFLSDFELDFLVPEYGSAPGLDGDEYPSASYDIFDDESEHHINDGFEENKTFFEKPVYAEGWKFYGNPLKERKNLGHASCLIQVGFISDLPVNGSLFDRAELLHQLTRYFNERDIGGFHKGYGEDENPFDLTEYRWPNFLAPLNSQWVKINGIEWLYSEVQPLRDQHDQVYWVTPLTHDRYLMVRHTIQRYCSNTGNPFRAEETTPIEAYRSLGEKIMSTMGLTFPGEWQSVRETYRNRGEANYPLPQLNMKKISAAIYTMYRWSGKEYFGKNKIRDEDPRAPKEQVAAFIHKRVQPRPLPGCVAIADAPSIEELEALDANWTGAIEHAI